MREDYRSHRTHKQWLHFVASTLQRAQAVLVIETFSSVLAGLPQAHYGITGKKKKKAFFTPLLLNVVCYNRRHINTSKQSLTRHGHSMTSLNHIWLPCWTWRQGETFTLHWASEFSSSNFSIDSVIVLKIIIHSKIIYFNSSPPLRERFCLLAWVFLANVNTKYNETWLCLFK